MCSYAYRGLRAEDMNVEIPEPINILLTKLPSAAATNAAAAAPHTHSGPFWDEGSDFDQADMSASGKMRESGRVSSCDMSASRCTSHFDGADVMTGASFFSKIQQAQQKRIWGDGSMKLSELLVDVHFIVYWSLHVAALVSLFFWRSWRLLGLCGATYTARMFGITGGYHRLLSHRSYKTSRIGQFMLACLGASALQKGPLWWASQHRHHHRTADTKEDAHSPVQWGFWWSHFGWFLCSTRHVDVLWPAVPDLARCPELLWLDSHHYVPPLILGAALYAAGGLPAFAWGFLISTVLCWHATYCINSVAHLVGSRRFRCEFNTHCDARNNLWLALATLGEGWHNNHHCYMRSARHGFYPDEVDVTWYVLLLLERLGIVWDLELPPLRQLEQHHYDDQHLRCRCHAVQADLRATASASWPK